MICVAPPDHMPCENTTDLSLVPHLPPPFVQFRLTSPATLVEIDRLLEEYTDAEVAAQLNQLGYRTFDGLLFQRTHVYQLRRHHGLAD